MLTYITLENFKSFKNKTKIDLRKTNYTILPHNVSKEDILKGLVFVGPNGSGKSTVLEAIKLFLDMMFGENNIFLTSFKSLLSNRNDFILEYAFAIKGSEILYKFSYNIKNEMLREELYKNSNLIFIRDGKDARSILGSKETFYDEKSIKPNGLFLRTLYFNNQFAQDEILDEWITFLKNSKYVNASPTENDFQEMTGAYNEYYENGGIDKINDFLKMISYGQRVFFDNTAEGNFHKVSTHKKVLFYEREGMHMPLPFTHESLGNRTLIKVLTSYLPVLEQGGILLVDEFSAGFHSALQEILIKYFMKTAIHSQIIIVSHSIPMLSNSILRPDQEYSIAFNGSNGSEIIRFSDMHPRNSQNISKMYMSGVFGGKPVYEENFEI